MTPEQRHRAIVRTKFLESANRRLKEKIERLENSIPGPAATRWKALVRAEVAGGAKSLEKAKSVVARANPTLRAQFINEANRGI